MAKNLIIVESPAKVKTIKRFLSADFEIEASKGHIRDLPKSTMGVDIKNDFEPKYVTIVGKGDFIAQLKKDADKAENIYLATDPDREGEAISWHLKIALGKKNAKKCSRISFNEITKSAVLKALDNPRDIDMNLVDAQQGRRVLDRIVGYTISPVLWQKLRRGLSAGRVQSVALRMICDRDEQILAFVPEEYHTVEALIKNGELYAKVLYYGENGKKKELKTKEEALRIVDDVKGKEVLVSLITHSDREKSAPWPFTTSTMQQDGSRKLNLSTQNIMRIAQKLYEEGLITYLRTDSIRVSDEAVNDAKNFILSNFGKNYLSKRLSQHKSGANIQDAHEAIRPTHIENTPESMKDKLSRDELRLYQLIWRRFIASRMAPAMYSDTKVTFKKDTHIFIATGSSVKFDGFMRLYTNDSDKDEKKQDLSFLTEGDEIIFNSIEDIQHFTQPPAHFTEATLVKTLEEDGIGRPSTYAPTIAILISRNYVERQKRNLISTQLGQTVNKFMKEAFPKVVDTGFTANLEGELDKVALGQMNWKDLIREYYPDLESAVENAKANIGHVKMKAEMTDLICEKCGRPMVIRYGRNGKFLGCSGFPECKNSMPYIEMKEGQAPLKAIEVTEEVCEKCGRPMVIKYGRFGKFLACSGYPECKNTRQLVEKIGVKCPKCGADILKRRTKKGRIFYACENKDCDFISWKILPSKQKVGQAVEMT